MSNRRVYTISVYYNKSQILLIVPKISSENINKNAFSRRGLILSINAQKL